MALACPLHWSDPGLHDPADPGRPAGLRPRKEGAPDEHRHTVDRRPRRDSRPARRPALRARLTRSSARGHRRQLRRRHRSARRRPGTAGAHRRRGSPSVPTTALHGRRRHRRPDQRAPAPPSGDLSPEETARARRSPVLLEAAEPEHRDPRPFSCPRHPAHPTTGRRGLRRPSQRREEEERQCRQTIDRTAVPPPTRAPRTARSSTDGARTRCAPAPARRPLPCRVEDPDLWFAESPAQLEHAKSFCADCPVRAACLAGALDRAEPWGVWGGEIFDRGVVIARKRPAGPSAEGPGGGGGVNRPPPDDPSRTPVRRPTSGRPVTRCTSTRRRRGRAVPPPRTRDVPDRCSGLARSYMDQRIAAGRRGRPGSPAAAPGAGPAAERASQRAARANGRRAGDVAAPAAAARRGAAGSRPDCPYG